MKLRVTFMEQCSDQAEHCTRCEMLGQPARIPAQERHWSMLDDEADADRAPRVTLCDDCAGFVKNTMEGS